jgi:hypothetical protein
VAAVSCSNSSSGGPDSARYSLFENSGALSQQFAGSAGSVTAASGCAQSSTWSGGQVACGMSGGRARIVWTKGGELLGDAQSSDLTSLHSWWINNR